MGKLKVSKCPGCKRRWAWLSDQAACIKVIGHCIVCWNEELDGELGKDASILMSRLDQHGIITERLRREKVAGYAVEPCPTCLHRRDKSKCNYCDGIGSVRIDVKTEETTNE